MTFVPSSILRLEAGPLSPQDFAPCRGENSTFCAGGLVLSQLHWGHWADGATVNQESPNEIRALWL